MQEEEEINKNKIILKTAIGKLLKQLRLKKKKSLTLFGYENSIPCSSLSYIERGVQDPSLTMLWRIVEAHGLTFSEFIRILEKDLPKGFYLNEF